jgi:hypothetical protein
MAALPVRAGVRCAGEPSSSLRELLRIRCVGDGKGAKAKKKRIVVHAPDLSASAAMLTMTTGRALKMARSTPIWQETREIIV